MKTNPKDMSDDYRQVTPTVMLTIHNSCELCLTMRVGQLGQTVASPVHGAHRGMDARRHGQGGGTCSYLEKL